MVTTIDDSFFLLTVGSLAVILQTCYTIGYDTTILNTESKFIGHPREVAKTMLGETRRRYTGTIKYLEQIFTIVPHITAGG